MSAYFSAPSGNSSDEDQDLARSAFADMLLDEDRNLKFREAIREAIKQKQSDGELAHVIDIGTGSGLLSLYAAEAGADQITAVEVFPPVAKIAQKIFDQSQHANRIRLLTSHSTDLRGLADGERGNILFAEVFDTELIGEGAIRTFKEAFQTLLLPNSLVIPTQARVWALPVECRELSRFYNFPFLSKSSPSHCPKNAGLFDLQASELEPGKDFIPASAPFIAFEFDFSAPSLLKYDDAVIRSFVVENPELKRIDAVIVWWELDMLGDDRIVISMAPKWQSPSSSWRDHWMQAVSFFPHSLHLPTENREILELKKCDIECFHDEFTIWFGVSDDKFDLSRRIKNPPLCICDFHLFYSRNQIHHLNDVSAHLIQHIQLECKRFGGNILCIGEGSLIGLHLAKQLRITDEIGSEKTETKLFIFEPNLYFHKHLLEIAEFNNFGNKIFKLIDDLYDQSFFSVCSKEPSLSVILEPFYLSCDGTIGMFSRAIHDAWKLYTKMGKTKLNFLPMGLKLFALPVSFDNLWKINAPVGNVHGHDLSAFDEENQRAKERVDPKVECHSLWEYPSAATGVPSQIWHFDLASVADVLSSSGQNNVLTISSYVSTMTPGTNGLVFWTETDFGQNASQKPPLRLTTTNGLIAPCEQGSKPKWNRGFRQSVHLIPTKIGFDKINGIGIQISINFPPLEDKFNVDVNDPALFSIDFNFTYDTFFN